MYPNFAKKIALILEKGAPFMYIYELNSHLNSPLKCSFKSILEKKHQLFPCGALPLYVVHEKFIEVPLFQETSPASKNS